MRIKRCINWLINHNINIIVSIIFDKWKIFSGERVIFVRQMISVTFKGAIMHGRSQSATLDPRQDVSTRTRQRFAPSAIQSLEVLSLPIASLEAYVNTMIEQNPLLDLDYDNAYLAFEELPEQDAPRSGDEGEDGDTTADFLNAQTTVSGERSGFDMNRLRDDRLETDTLQSHLRMQLSRLSLDGRRGPFLLALIESIDDDGYFAGSLPSLCFSSGMAVDEGEALLKVVQSLSPRGVGARTLRECLTLQIGENEPHRDTIISIIEDRFEDLAKNRVSLLEREYGLRHDELREIKEVIRSLDPRPGAAFSQRRDTCYLIPDLVIRRSDGRFSVEVTGEVSGTIVLNKQYIAMLDDRTVQDGELEWLASRHDEARTVLRNIEQRKKTLYRFGLFLVEAQYEFFCFGEARIKPLTMQNSADALGVHVSTVSRTVQDKYVLTPWGTYPLKYFFASSVECVKAERRSAMSSVAIKNRIKEIVAGEDRDKPLSDSALTAVLNDEGIEVKRRTVAKYREALGIGRQSQRRW